MMRRTRLASEAAKLDRTEEQGRADEVYAGEAEWPEYTAKLNEVYATEESALDPVLQSIQSRSISGPILLPDGQDAEYADLLVNHSAAV